MPATVASHRDYTAQRGGKMPPHASLRSLRRVAGLTLEEVASRIVAEVPELEGLSRGTLSAIESGSRGVSGLMLRAIELAFGLDEGELVTDYEPRAAARSTEDAA